jgi:two-component system, OmpR family, sensor histidine kinase KdpD
MASWKPITMSFGAVSLTTAILIAVDSGAELEHLEIAYLFPTALIAVLYGSNFAFLTSCASAITAAYFLLPPRFSLHIANPLHIVELGFFVVVALIAGKIVSLLMHDAPRQLLDATRQDREAAKRHGNSASRTIAEQQADST